MNDYWWINCSKIQFMTVINKYTLVIDQKTKIHEEMSVRLSLLFPKFINFTVKFN